MRTSPTQKEKIMDFVTYNHLHDLRRYNERRITELSDLAKNAVKSEDIEMLEVIMESLATLRLKVQDILEARRAK
jgi:hypothetical protein